MYILGFNVFTHNIPSIPSRTMEIAEEYKYQQKEKSIL
jgi:hypothetical protein